MELTCIEKTEQSRRVASTEHAVDVFGPRNLKSQQERNLMQCSRRKRRNCCSAGPINKNSNKNSKDSCKPCGSCPKQSQSIGNENSEVSITEFNDVPSFGVYEADFPDVVKNNADFDPKETLAIVGANDTDSVDTCTANRYMIYNFETFTLTCNDLEIYDCGNNEDLQIDFLEELVCSNLSFCSMTDYSSCSEGLSCSANVTYYGSCGMCASYRTVDECYDDELDTWSSCTYENATSTEREYSGLSF